MFNPRFRLQPVLLLLAGLLSLGPVAADPPATSVMTPERLWQLGRVSEPRVAPDGQTLLFGVKYYDLAANRGNRDLHRIGLDGRDRRQLTFTPASEDGAQWRPDGQRIGFLFENQIWEMNPDGSDRRPLTDLPAGVTGFAWSPDQRRILLTSPVPAPRIGADLFAGLDQTSGRLVDDLMYRHWDTWVETHSHIFVADYQPGQPLSGLVDIMAGEPWESPLAPFGGMEQIVWSPDGNRIVYTARKKTGLDYALSTNSDLYLYDLTTGTTRNLTAGNLGYDTNPAFAPDGRRLAWLSMERDGYESDENRLFVMDLATGTQTFLTQGLDRDVASFVWSGDGRTLYFIASDRGTTPIHAVPARGGAVTRLTTGPHAYTSLIWAGSELVATRASFSGPDDLYRVNPRTGQARPLTRENAARLADVRMGEVQERWVRTTDGRNMQVWVVLPPGFDPAQRYPAVLYCMGGPEGALDHNWSYRWNLQTLAARGYVVVAPNRRGTLGFGREWTEGVRGDWGGQAMQDLLAAIDDISREPWVDRDRLAAAGPSFGGFSVYWLAGNHEGRFKALVAHDGIFNLESMYLETEEMWFANDEYRGPFWEADWDPEVARAYAGSPHRFVQNWDTPLLVIHSERDYRVVFSQGLSAFNAAILQGIPARFLSFPDENHWVLTPQNSVLWYRTVIDWLDRWLKDPT